MAEEVVVELERVAPHRPRWRRWTVRGIGAIAAVALLAAILTDGGDEPADLEIASPAHADVQPPHVGSVTSGGASEPFVNSETTSTTESAPDASGGSEVFVPADGDGPEVSPGSTTPASTTSTTVCANSFDAACGPFRWTTLPEANQPMTASIELITEDPTSGEDQRIEFRVRASDPDASPIGGDSVWVDRPWVDPQLSYENCYHHGVHEGFGPWAPPSVRPGSIDLVADTRVLESGTWRFYVCIASISWIFPGHDAGNVAAQTWCPGDPTSRGFEGFTCRDPYGDLATPYIDVLVR